MLNRIDQWLGREIIHPPVIWVCQRTGISQNAVARYAWMLAAWTLVMRVRWDNVSDMIFAAFIVVIALADTSLAATNPDRPVRSVPWLRWFIVALTVIDIIALAVVTGQRGFPGFGWNHAWDLFAVVGEYAKTIRKIPPRKLDEAANQSRRPIKVTVRR